MDKVLPSGKHNDAIRTTMATLVARACCSGQFTVPQRIEALHRPTLI